MSARGLRFSSVLLLTTLAMCGVVTSAASSQPSASPTTAPASRSDTAAMSSPSPGPSASATVDTASPSPLVDPGYCSLLENADVARFVGAELISVEEVSPQAMGTLLGGCVAIAANSISLALRHHDASEWDEHITGFGFEPLPTLPDAHFSDIVGLAYRLADGETYLTVSLRPGFGVNDHLRALYLILGRPIDRTLSGEPMATPPA